VREKIKKGKTRYESEHVTDFDKSSENGTQAVFAQSNVPCGTIDKTAD
jgi:hypothetical protein